MTSSNWRSPLDEFTLRFLIKQLTNDREHYIDVAREVRTLEEEAGEAFLIRAEECGRVIDQLQKQLDKMASVPPPAPSSLPPPLPPKPKRPW